MALLLFVALMLPNLGALKPLVVAPPTELFPAFKTCGGDVEFTIGADTRSACINAALRGDEINNDWSDSFNEASKPMPPRGAKRVKSVSKQSSV